MCGIAGLISPTQKYSSLHLQKMIKCLAHRGPDGERTWTNSGKFVHLAHRRLAVIDLSDAGSQPMHLNDRYTIVHNGEIYNYPQIKQRLIREGYKFHSQSDTEVLLAAFDYWKEDCLEQLDGMFAFAIWDEKEKILFAARDRFGQKPFYYHFDEAGRQLLFASELKAFRDLGLNIGINERQMLLFLSHGFTNDVRNPASTFYTSILQLPPAHRLFFRPFSTTDALKVGSWWDLDKEDQQQIKPEDAIEQFKHLFTESVRRSYISDIPVGTCLSGGLDSSSIVAVANELEVRNNSHKVFSAVFPGFDKDESRYAEVVSRHFELDRFTVSLPQPAEDFEIFLSRQDEPVSSGSVYAQYKVFQLAREHGIKVLLDGQGSDEILGGYGRYIHWFLQELVFRDRSLQKKELGALRNNNLPVQWNWKNYFAAIFPAQAAGRLEKKARQHIHRNKDLNEGFVQSYINTELIYKPIVTRLNDLLYFNTCQGGLQELLRYADRSSMAHGCEVRLPFLNHQLVEFIFSLPSTLKIHDGYTKWILRKSMDNSLPAEIVWRKDKIGFEPPQENWMQGEKLQQMIGDARGQLVKEKFLNESVLHKKIQPHASHAAESFEWRYLAAAYWMQP